MHVVQLTVVVVVVVVAVVVLFAPRRGLRLSLVFVPPYTFYPSPPPHPPTHLSLILRPRANLRFFPSRVRSLYQLGSARVSRPRGESAQHGRGLRSDSFMTRRLDFEGKRAVERTPDGDDGGEQ